MLVNINFFGVIFKNIYELKYEIYEINNFNLKNLSVDDSVIRAMGRNF